VIVDQVVDGDDAAVGRPGRVHGVDERVCGELARLAPVRAGDDQGHRNVALGEVALDGPAQVRELRAVRREGPPAEPILRGADHQDAGDAGRRGRWKDHASGRVQPREGRVDEVGEGVMIALLRASDEL
jgi:hypothetical protein